MACFKVEIDLLILIGDDRKRQFYEKLQSCLELHIHVTVYMDMKIVTILP